MAIQQIQSMLERCSTEETLFPPTILYNEGWMLRLVINWFATHPITGYCLSFPENGNWYSEALLPSPFLPRYRGDRFAESWTHADGVIGHFAIGRDGARDLSLLPCATHLVILEATMFSKLSAGVTHAKYYNQAARNVACIAEILKRGKRQPSELNSLGFYVIAPQSQIEEGVFADLMTHGSVRKTVEHRVDEYDESKEDWFRGWFLPTLAKIDLRSMSWEEIISEIIEVDSSPAKCLKDFYELCLRFDRLEPAQ